MMTVWIAAMMTMTPEPAFEELRIDGPEGPLSALLSDPAPDAPALVLIPGSGPIDRDGSIPGMNGGRIYEQLASQLAERGIAVLRADKRGMHASSAAIADANKVSLGAYARDAHGWADLLVERGKPCAWLLGHSEGALVALTAAADPANLCGIISLAGPGRPTGVLLREQLGAQLPAPMMADVETALAAIEAGEEPDTSSLPPPVAAIFNPAVRDYLSELIVTDPAALAGASDLPLAIIHLGEDLQVRAADADALAAARPDATRIDLAGLNHVMKAVEPGNRTDNQVSYMDASRTVDPRLADAIASIVKD